MGTYTYRLPPCAWYDSKTMERWLEDMAAKGLILGQEGIFPGMVAFEKGQPQNLRYRLVTSPHPYRKARAFRYAPIPDEETQAFHGEFGWHYIATRRDFHIYVCADPHAPEMDTDPRIQALAYSQAAKRQWADVVCYCAILLCYLGMFLWDGYKYLLGSSYRLNLSHLWLAGMWLFYVIPSIVDLRQLRKRQKQLEEGRFLPEAPDRRKTTAGYRFTLAGKALVVLCLILSLFLTSPLVYPEEDWVPLNAYSGEIPFATMQELLPDAQLREDAAWVNHILHRSTGLSDTWQLHQQLHITLPDGTQTSGSLYITRRDIKVASAARQQAKQAWKQGCKTGQEPAKLEIDGVDLCFHYSKDARVYVILQKGNQFVHVSFHIYEGIPVTPEQIALIMASRLG